MVWKKILCILFCISIFTVTNSYSQNVSGSKLKDATSTLKEVYLKYNGIYELTGRNDNSVITTINKSYRIPLNSAYCGTSLYYFCIEAGFTLDIPKSKAPVARNWGLYGETIWTVYNGWKVNAKHTPEEDEIFVLLFNHNGSNHITCILDYHKDLYYITGEGNTSDIKVRKQEYLYYNNVISKRKDIYIASYRRQGIFAGKERYKTIGMYKIIKYKVR